MAGIDNHNDVNSDLDVGINFTLPLIVLSEALYSSSDFKHLYLF
jgi:hypothetical protein